MGWRDTEIEGFEIGAMNPKVALSPAGFAQIARTKLARPPLVQAVPTRMGGGYEAATAVGLGTVAFGEAGVVAVLTVVLQIAIRPRRIVLEFVESGAVAAGMLTVTGIFIGNQPILGGAGGVPIGAFAPNSVGPMLVNVPGTPGLNLTVNLARTAAPGAGTDVIVGGVLFGESL